MDKDTLEKAAMLEAYNYANPDSDEPCYDADFYEGFKQGAEWLMGQPLSERLTEEDVDNLNNVIFLMRGMAASNQMSYDCLKHISNALYDIFGKEIFEKQRRYAVM